MAYCVTLRRRQIVANLLTQKMFNKIYRYFKTRHKPSATAIEFLKYLGPGLLVTVGFIDPGNWAANVSAGATYGYTLLWVITISTIMLIVLQHNAAHLGIVTGLCLSEAATKFTKPALGRTIILTAVAAAIATAFAEILGAAIALNMLFKLPLRIGAVLVAITISVLLFTNSYRRIEKLILAFVSLIGFAFIFELWLVDIEWATASQSWLTPAFPQDSIIIIMSALGAVVMPHNLFLHSEIIQSRQWNLSEKSVIEKQLKFEFLDTFFSMMVGWAINSSMILVAAATFYANKVPVDSIEQAQAMLSPIVGNSAALVFALALLFAGIASSITAGIAGGSIFAGMFSEPYNISDRHSRLGVGVIILIATGAIFLIDNTFKGLVYSQVILSIQLPLTIFLQIYLTSSKKVMGGFANKPYEKIALVLIGSFVSLLNLLLLKNLLLD